MGNKTRLLARTILEPPYVFAKNIYNLVGGNRNPSRSGFVSAAATTTALVALLSSIEIGVSVIDSYLSGDYSRLARKIGSYLHPLTITILTSTPLAIGYCAKVVIDERMEEIVRT